MIFSSSFLLSALVPHTGGEGCARQRAGEREEDDARGGGRIGEGRSGSDEQPYFESRRGERPRTTNYEGVGGDVRRRG